jgi:hypothetical protein
MPIRLLRYILRPTIANEVAIANKASSDTRTVNETLGILWDVTTSLQAQIQGLWERLEFVRAETMFEMQTLLRIGERKAGDIPVVESRHCNREKVEIAISSGTVKLNVGCGHIPLDGYLNVDSRELPSVDVVADVASLPFDDGTLQEIYSSHLLEHFPVEQLNRVVLPHWLTKLRPGAILSAIVPDAEGMISDYVSGQMTFEELREVTFGLQEYNGDFHFNMFNKNSLKALLERAGFSNVRFAFENRKNGKCRDMHVIAVKP